MIHKKSLETDAEEILAAMLAGSLDALVDEGGIHVLPLAERSYRDFFEAMDQSAATLGQDGTILHCNQKFGSLIGQTVEELRGRSFLDLVAADGHREAGNLLRGADRNTAEVDLLSAAGVRTPVRLSVSRASAGGVSVLCIVATDMADHRRTQADLREQEAKYRAAIATCVDGFLILDKHGRIVEVNDAYLRLSGYSRTELHSMKIRDLDVGLTHEHLSARHAAVVETGGDHFETLHRAVDGRIWPAEITASYWPEGNRFFVFVHDITARKRGEKRISDLVERMELATGAARIGIWDLDPVTEKLVWNAQMLFLFGLAEAEFHGTINDWRSRIHPDDAVRFDAEYLLAQFSAGNYDAEFRIIRPDGIVRMLKTHADIHRDANGRPIRILGATWDVTDYRTILENFREAKEKADAASAAKSRFLATMSHELRTPLNAIIGFGQMLATSEQNETRREELEIICQAGADLLKLIQEILDLSRIEAGKVPLELRAFDLRELLERTTRLLQPQIDQKGLVLTTSTANDMPKRLVGDPEVLRQVLVNLIGNAIKFTPQGRIEVTAECCAPADGSNRTMILFQVADTGIGIRPENQSRIFDIFEQEDNSLTRPYGGSGLGLAISKKMVTLLGGNIWLDSRVGIGSRFSFTAYFDSGEPEAITAHKPNADQRLTKAAHRLLVVEDDLFSRQLMLNLLENHGFQVTCAENGIAALTELNRGRFDLILMDVRMPEMSGIEVTRRVRSGSVVGCPTDIPIIGVTAHAMYGDRERFLELGMSDYVSKPIDANDLMKAICRGLAPLSGADN